MKIEVCKKCKHFTRHHVHTKFIGFSPVDCGHCYKKLMKKANCENFEESENIAEDDISIINSFLIYERKLNKLQDTFTLLLNSTNNIKNEILSLEKSINNVLYFYFIISATTSILSTQ